VNGAELLDGMVREKRRFVVFPKWGAETFALWDLHTYAWQLREVATYIAIESPEKECGKSTLITLLSHFVNRPAVSSNISPSAFFRVIEELQPTLLIDEADTNLRGKDDLMGILNSGYTRPTGFVWRIS
jgi:putative DNA primase/helicase